MHENTKADVGEVKAGRSMKTIAAWGCGALLLVGGIAFALITAAVVFTVKDTIDTVDEVRTFADGFAGEIKSGDYDRLHARLSEELGSEMSPADLNETFALMRPVVAVVPPTPFIVAKSDDNPKHWEAFTTIGSPVAPMAQTIHLVIAREPSSSGSRYSIVELSTDFALRDLSAFPQSERALAFHQALIDGDVSRARGMIDASFEDEAALSLEEQVEAFKPIRDKQVEVVAFLPLDERRVDVTLVIHENPQAPTVTYQVDVNKKVHAMKGPRSMSINELDPLRKAPKEMLDEIVRELSAIP
ncbi:hypothetical protein EA187_09435 [Lujinxingia sediminis]|uniref:DUF3014 domain-containing protein n=1 Tax=Lujinxingia sediminis TaxID=2480984 RepID=A0ABY0CUE0_9DELT|nr:hypothetical protein [Lujinxingia sediminis]RVU44754.1 hypothetical protein EA187_09435 [Lujinxingia sediminis]